MNLEATLSSRDFLKVLLDDLIRFEMAGKNAASDWLGSDSDVAEDALDDPEVSVGQFDDAATGREDAGNCATGSGLRSGSPSAK